MEEEDEESFGEVIAVPSETTEAEKQYEKVLNALRDEEGMKLYSDVYTKLYDSYFIRKEDNLKLQDEINNLKSKLSRFDDTITEYQTEITEGNRTIDKLREEIREAKNLADAMHARELASVESLETMKKSVVRLEKELDVLKRAGDEDVGATSAAKEKEKFEKEKTRLVGEIEGMKVRLDNCLSYNAEMETKATETEEKIEKLEEQLEEAENNAVRNGRLIEHLKNESLAFKQEVENRGNAISNLTDTLAKSDKTIERRNKQIKDLTQKVAIAKAEQEAAEAKANAARDRYDKLRKDYDKEKQDLVNGLREIKMLKDEATKQRNEMIKLQKNNIHQAKRYVLLENAKMDLQMEVDRFRQQFSVMERDIMLGKKQTESDRRDIENLNREKDILNKTMLKIQHDAMENLSMLTLSEQRRKQQEHEIDMNAAQINKQRLMIRALEKDKDRMLEETIALNEKIDDISDEVRLKNAAIVDLKKALGEETIANKKLSAALDATRSERNMLHKNYTEALDEIQDLKQKLKLVLELCAKWMQKHEGLEMLAYQIEQLKEDISGKEASLKTCEASINKCNKKVEVLRGEIQNGVAKLSDARAEITALRQEETRLNRIIGETDASRAKLSKELEGLMNERDVIGAQLVRRNDEISLLYEKIRILEITLQRGERQYEQRIEDIRLLRLEILRLRKEKNLLAKGIENMTDLRLEVFNIERELARERLRVRALEEALETPLNVHRWRKLQGTDPESVTLTHKLRLTQKKVLAQSEMLVLKDRELKETKNLYGAVKDMLALQPSPEIKQTLTKTQRALAQRTTKTKCLIAEVSMRERQVTDLNREMDRLTGELNSYKQKYFEMKRALDADEARRLRIPSPKTLVPPSPPPVIEKFPLRSMVRTEEIIPGAGCGCK